MRKIPILVLFLVTMALPFHLRADTAYTAIVSNEAPVLYWNFDEGSGPAKQIMPLSVPPITNSLSPVLTAIRVDHSSLGDGLKLGNAINFQLEGDCFSGRLNTTIPLLQPPYALEFWVQVLGDTNTQRFDYVMGFGTGNYPAVLYDYNTPRLSFEMYSQDAGRSGVGPAILDSNWHHLVIAYYGDGTTGVGNRLSMYLDGTNAAPDVRANFHRALDLSRITAGTVNPTAADGFIGSLDELAIYNLHSLTNEAQITAKVSGISSNHFAMATNAASPEVYSQAVLADSPFLYWNFNEADGDALEIAPQTLPPANSLYPLNNASYVSHSPGEGLGLGSAASMTVQSNGFAPVFATAGTYGIPTTINPPYAIEFWVQIQGDTNGTPLTHRFDYVLAFNGNFPAVIYDYNDPRFAWELFSTGGGGRSALGASFVDYSWHHIVFVYYGDGNTGVADRLSMYLDGTNAAPSMRGTFTRAIQTASVVAGCYNTSGALVDTFFGNIDELAIYDLGSLTDEGQVTAKADAIASHYAAAKIAVPPTLTIMRSGANVITSWPSPSTGYVLQTASSLLGPWTAEGSTPVTVGTNLQVTLPASSTNLFFRLQK
jgi:hypothetical protein